MKRIILTFCVLYLHLSGFSQLNNGGFTQFTGICYAIPTTGYCENLGPTFEEGCVVNWHVSHGTPQIIEHYRQPRTGFVDYGGYMVQTIDGQSEGLWADYNWKPNTNYIVTVWAIHFEITAGILPEFFVYAVNNMQALNNLCSGDQQGELPNYPTKALIAREHSSGGVWSPYTFYFKTPTFTPGEWKSLWFYPYAAGGRMDFLIDHVKVEENTCDVEKNYIRDVPTDADVNNDGKVVRIGNKSSPGVLVNHTSINSGSDLYASQFIEFLPNTESFITVASGAFTAAIQPCGGGTGTASASRSVSEMSVLTPEKMSMHLSEPDTNSVSLALRPKFLDGVAPSIKQKTHQYSLAPNPASSFITIIGNSGKGISRVTIYNSQGAVMKNADFDGHIKSVTVSISGTPPGNYYAKISGPGGSEVKNLQIR